MSTTLEWSAYWPEVTLVRTFSLPFVRSLSLKLFTTKTISLGGGCSVSLQSLLQPGHEYGAPPGTFTRAVGRWLASILSLLRRMQRTLKAHFTYRSFRGRSRKRLEVLSPKI